VYAQAIEANPESLLVNPFGLNLFNPMWNDERCFETVAQKWIDAVQRQASNPVVLARAGAFLMGSPAFHQYAEQGEGLLQKGFFRNFPVNLYWLQGRSTGGGA
jgi:hypothetical protein